MIELPQSSYNMIKKLLEGIEINTLFALAVVEQQVKGRIFVNFLENPTTFYITHPYGMSLLLGETTHPTFNHHLKEYLENKMQLRTSIEWLQVYPALEWTQTLENLLGDSLVKFPQNSSQETSKILYYQRINFNFFRSHYNAHKTENIIDGYRIVKTSKEMFEHMKGSVIPKYFWNSAEDFETKSVGFSAIDNEGTLLATAFASFVIGSKLELGIETNTNHRSKGLAYAVCSRLIDFCLEHELEPIWACSSLNHASQKLAEKLGFEVVREIPYYKLPFREL